jgi:hypothetical protein
VKSLPDLAPLASGFSVSLSIPWNREGNAPFREVSRPARQVSPRHAPELSPHGVS